MKSPLIRTLGLASWAITAFASLHHGLVALGWMGSLLPKFGPLFGQVLAWLFTLAGAYSFVLFFKSLLGGGDCWGGDCNGHN